MRVFAIVVVVVGLLTATAAAEARDRRTVKHGKATPRVAVTSPAKPSAGAPKLRDRSIGAPWSGRLQAPARLKSGERYHLRRPWRTYGTRTTIELVRRAIVDTLAACPKVHALAVGDLSSETGGRITEHRSHQSGRDIDLGLFYKHKPAAYPGVFVRATAATLDAAATWKLVSNLARTADEDGGTQFIFLDQQLQHALYRWAETRGISARRITQVQRVLRHVPLHADHLHVRFKCRERDTSCR